MSKANKRSSLQLLLIAALFLTPFVAALLMRFGGWEPPRTRNFGELLSPPISMAGTTARGPDGVLAWVNEERHWTLLLRLPADCAAECQRSATLLPQVHLALGRHFDKLHPYQVGAAATATPVFPLIELAGPLPPPLAALPAAMPVVWLVDPHGYLVMHYAEGFDPSGLRRDLSRLIK